MVTKLTNNKQPYCKGYSLILIADPETKSSTLSKNSNQVTKENLKLNFSVKYVNLKS